MVGVVWRKVLLDGKAAAMVSDDAQRRDATNAPLSGARPGYR